MFTLLPSKHTETSMWNLHLHKSHFTDPLFELSRTEYEIGHCNTIQYNAIQCKNLIAQYDLVIVQQLHTVYNLSITNYFPYVHSMKLAIFYRCS